jgi:hypothetical protein
MNSNADVFGSEGSVLAELFSVVTAICVGAKEKKRKRKVPRNSPVIATKWLRIVLRDPEAQFPREWVLVVVVGLLAALLVAS